MSKKGMNRRQFLQTSSLAAAGAAAVASGAVLVAPDGAWALQLRALSEHDALTILVMSRTIYPHDSLGDMYYAKVVQDLDGAAAGDEGTARLLKDGVAELDGAMGVNFADLSEGNRLSVLTERESSGFFQKVRGQCIVSIYNNPLAWRHFGYEGASAEFGGYIDRGFDDLGWLPQPPEDASPKAG